MSLDQCPTCCTHSCFIRHLVQMDQPTNWGFPEPWDRVYCPGGALSGQRSGTLGGIIISGTRSLLGFSAKLFEFRECAAPGNITGGQVNTQLSTQGADQNNDLQ
mmetsp:Transcript_43725/g.126293  ORF Transcript_43725/g.126293 Transcript_43725/m.126293 type:complete len:104 (+) Transcript_43725:1551-1862(+)